MTDLISRQAAQAINVLPKFYREYQTGNLDDAYEKGWEDAMFSLNALPTIEPFSTSGYVTTVTDLPPVEYVPVVRCKDCKWYGTDYECENSDSPCFHNGSVNGNWFCADGERSEDA